MALRKNALSDPSFKALKALYDDRKAVLQKLKAEGKKVVLVAGYDVPDELILAAGMVPFRVTGYYGGERVSAEKYLEYSFGSIWKGIWESIAEDYAGLADYLVFSSSSDMFLKLYYYFRTLKRLEPERVLPDMFYLDLELVDKKLKTQERNERELRRLASTLEEWSGNKITEEGIKNEIILCNEYRDALRAFADLRKKDSCRVLGSEALVVIGGSLFAERNEAVKLVKEVTAAAENWPEAEGTRLYYVGSPQETTEVYELAEEAGCNIVGEDHDMGCRMFDTNVRTDIEAVSALAERLISRMPSSEKGSIKDRVKFIGEKLEETQADLLLTFMNNNDEAYVWDLPSVKKNILDPKGIPFATVEKQTWPLKDREALKAQFAEMAKAGKEAK